MCSMYVYAERNLSKKKKSNFRYVQYRIVYTYTFSLIITCMHNYNSYNFTLI